ncbi:alpha/beta hydrolase [Tamlana fucoidanivorans]|uniref:Alpha/beta hydrolase n=1 Tax=Allotamlana fucoidanivorans TaxID=2583814 RepID=A0A5C4SJU9_9FLAO|nr:alpha/beta hydrolase [Tamlana fucoidanivorans]TNJ43821.1 alpha/beta hydrolase [Tamlana fucoidanivorans]
MKYIQRKGDKKGVVIFIHGNSSSSRVFHLDGFEASHCYSQIAIDLPGHGEAINENQTVEDFSISSYNKLCIDFINNLDEDILLVGNSLGGHIAIEIASHIRRLKGLVIFGTPPIKKPINFDEAFLPISELQTYFIENPLESQIKETAQLAVFDKDKSSIIIEDFKVTNPMVRLAVAKAIAEAAFQDEYEIFMNLNVNKYILAGTHDPSVNLEYLKYIAKQCDTNCELIIFEKCGHFISHEKPDAFNKAVAQIAKEVF